MKVDYYGWALVLGVGWQGWKRCLYLILYQLRSRQHKGLCSIKKATQNYSIRYKHCFHPRQPTPKTSAHP